MAAAMDWEGQTAGRPGGVCGNGHVQVTTHLPTAFSDKPEPISNVGGEEGSGLPPSPAGYQDSCESWLASAWVGGHHHQMEPKPCSPTKEWTGALKEFESSIYDIEAGLQNIARKLETKATDITVAMKDLQWVWDELDSWHQRIALLEAAMQDYEGQHPERAPGLGDAAFSLAKLYNVLRSQAERRTDKLRRAESLMEQYEARRTFVLKWVEKAQGVGANDVSAHQALLEQSRDVLAGLEAMVECVDALSEACSVECLVQQVSELDQRTTAQHGTLQHRLRSLWGPSEDELVAMGADFQLLQAQLSSPALNAFGHAPQLALRRRLLAKLGTLAEQLDHRPRAGTYSVLRDAVVHLRDVTEQQCAALQTALAKAEWRVCERRRLQELIAEAEEELWNLGASKHGDSPRIGSHRLALARRIRGYWESIAGLMVNGDLVKRRSRHPAAMRKSGPPLVLPPLVEAEEEWENDNCGIIPSAGCCSPSAQTDDASLNRDIAFFQALTPEDLLAAVERIMQERGEAELEAIDSEWAPDFPPPSMLATPTLDRGSEEDPTAIAETLRLDVTAAAASGLPTALLLEAGNAGVLPELPYGGGLTVSCRVKQQTNDNSPTRTVATPSGARDHLAQSGAPPPPPPHTDTRGNGGAGVEPAPGRKETVAGGGADEITSVEKRATLERAGVDAHKRPAARAPSDVPDGKPERDGAGSLDDADAPETNGGGDVEPQRAAAAVAAAAGSERPAEVRGSPSRTALDQMCQDFESWLEPLERRVSVRDSSATLGFPQTRDELHAFVAVQHEVQQGLTRLEELKVRHRKLLCSGDPATVATLRPRVQACNHRWVGLKKAVATRIKNLRRSVAQWEEFEGACKGLMVWLTETDLRLTNLEHFGECEAQARSDQLRVLQGELVKRQETLNSLRRQAERLAEAGANGDAGPAGHRVEEALRYFTETSVRVTRYLGRSSIIAMPSHSGEGDQSPPGTSGAAHVMKPLLSSEPNGPSFCESQRPRPESNRQPQEKRVSNPPHPSPPAMICGNVVGDTSLSPSAFANSLAARRDCEALGPAGDTAGRCHRLTSTPVKDASPHTSELSGDATSLGPARRGAAPSWSGEGDSPASRGSLASDAWTPSVSEGGGASAGTPAELSFAQESPFGLDWSLRPARACKASPSLSLQWDSYDLRAEPAGEFLGEMSLGLARDESLPFTEEGDVVNSGAGGGCGPDEAGRSGIGADEGKRIFKSAIEDVGVWMDLAEAPNHENNLFLRKKDSPRISQLQKQGAEASCVPTEPSYEPTGLQDDDSDSAHLLECGEEPRAAGRRPSLGAEIRWGARSSPWRWRASGWRCRWLDICRALRTLRPLPRLLVAILAAAGFLVWAGCFSIGGAPRVPPS